MFDSPGLAAGAAELNRQLRCKKGTLMDDTVYRLTRADLEAHAGRPLTDDEVADIVRALDNSTLGEVVGDVVFACIGG